MRRCTANRSLVKESGVRQCHGLVWLRKESMMQDVLYPMQVLHIRLDKLGYTIDGERSLWWWFINFFECCWILRILLWLLLLTVHGDDDLQIRRNWTNFKSSPQSLPTQKEWSSRLYSSVHDGSKLFSSVYDKKDVANSRIWTYARRTHLISSQTP